MKTCRLAVVAVVLLGSWALPVRALTMPVPDRGLPEQLLINLAWQIALDKAHFSPGVIDGKFGAKGTMALREYAAAKHPGLQPFDRKVYEALGVDPGNAVAFYTVTEEDAAQVGVVPTDWNEKARQTVLPYESLHDMVAEKFRSSESLLVRLNPGKNLARLNVGDTIVVPNVVPFEGAAAAKAAKANQMGADHMTINVVEKTIRIYDAEGKQLALFHCSVAADKAKLPGADTTIKRMVANPNYTFRPSMWPEVRNVTQVLTIPPGPRNPVGLVWMELGLPGYGMHGVPKPEMIGKTGSHGCFRLTNWDAVAVYGYAKTGMKVKVVGEGR